MHLSRHLLGGVDIGQRRRLQAPLFAFSGNLKGSHPSKHPSSFEAVGRADLTCRLCKSLVPGADCQIALPSASHLSPASAHTLPPQTMSNIVVLGYSRSSPPPQSILMADTGPQRGRVRPHDRPATPPRQPPPPHHHRGQAHAGRLRHRVRLAVGRGQLPPVSTGEPRV